MTHTEDIKRVNIMTEDFEQYLHNRIEALENRVAFLEAQLEVSKQSNLKQ
jgi:tetrahydromethanopterin S-methyltransferase subunit G